MSEICLNGAEITTENIFNIAYKEETKIKIDNSSKEKVNAAQKLILNAQNGQIPVYGLTRDVGQFKNESLENKLNHDMEVLADHSTTLGDDCEKYPIEICKGAWAIMINGFLRGGSCATWELIETMLSWVNSKDNKTCQNVEYGTGVGMADAVPLMQMAIDILPKLNYEIKPGEGLALLSSNALSMSEASIVCSKLKKILDLAELGNALAILAENGNNSIIEEPGLNAAKHWKQKTQIINRMQELLKDSEKNSVDSDDLHSHLTLRASCDILASAKEALEFSIEILEQMMNSHQGNPFVDTLSDRIGSVANFDTTRLYNVFTYLQTSFGSLLTSLARRGEFKVNKYGPSLNRKCLIQRYILWHLETSWKSGTLNAQAVPFTLSRMSGAQGIEDWAPPLPQVCSRLTKFVIFFKRVVILEALISTLVINAREFKINNFELSEFYNILLENSPLDVKSDQQYSMKNLFDCIRERYHV